jgi:hypothetical protein
MVDNGNHTIGAPAFHRASSNVTISFSGSKAESGFLLFLAGDLPKVTSNKKEDHLRGKAKLFSASVLSTVVYGDF